MIDFSTTQTAKVSLEFLLKLGQYLGYFPVCQNYFKWTSWKMVYVLFLSLSALLYSIVVLISAVKEIQNEFSFFTFENIFCTVAFLYNRILLFHLATKLPKIMNEWCQIDRVMTKTYGHPKHLKLIIILLSSTFLLLNVAVFIFRQISTYSKISENLKEPLSVDKYFKIYYSNVFSIIFYRWYFVIFLLVLEPIGSLMPTYTDVLLIAISTVLAYRFRQISKTLKHRNQFESGANLFFWKNIRKDYCRMSKLLFTLDDHISHIIIFSYGLNFFFLLHFLTEFLRGTETNPIAKTCNYLNAISFISRMTCLTLMASWINEESQEPIAVLNSVEQDNAEIERLLLQLSFDEVALTGGKMFKLNKSLLLSVVGAVVTYELMIIQYNNSYLELTQE